MEKRDFKASFISLLEQDVRGLAQDKKVKYMKKWIREYEQIQEQEVVVEQGRERDIIQLDRKSKNRRAGENNTKRTGKSSVNNP